MEENLKILESLDYYYDKKENKFWSYHYESWLPLPIEDCYDLLKIIKALMSFASSNAYHKGECDSLAKVRRALGLA